MKNIENKSLGELEALYQQKLQQWTDRRAGLLKEIEKCEAQMQAYDQKLRYIRALVNGPEAAAAAPVPKTVIRQPATGKKQKRRRWSPIRDATLKVLRNRPGQKLTVAEIRTAIRKDMNRRGSRQSVNVNCDILEEAGLVKRERAPKGTGARFVFYAV